VPRIWPGEVRDRLSVGRGGARGPCFGAGARRVLHAHLSCERAGHVRAAEDREYKQGQRERGLDERLSALACVMTISGGTTLGYAFIVRVSVSSQNLGMEADEVSKRQAEFHLLDVREDDEWAAGHIDGAQHIFYGEQDCRARREKGRSRRVQTREFHLRIVHNLTVVNSWAYSDAAGFGTTSIRPR